MSNTESPPTLEHVLARSLDLYDCFAEILGETTEVASHRDLLTQGTCEVAFEHGLSVYLLIRERRPISAIALQRLQFEALVRALWLHAVATDNWIARYFATVKANPMKDPNISPTIGEMLEAIGRSAHAPAARLLGDLKDAAWGPLNSYVHSGVHPVVQQSTGFSEQQIISVLLNSNGLTGMTATLVAMIANDPTKARAIVAAQHAHLDCLPPLETTPPAQSTQPATPD